MIEKIKECLNFLSGNGFNEAEVGIILGTGLGKLTEKITIEQSISYKDIPHFPQSTVESHKGQLLLGTLEGKKVICMQGRFHYYEGYSQQQITFPVRIMKQLGVKHLIISNAAGAINLNFKKGELMVIDDHINLLPENPLRGVHLEEYGPRFVDMSQPYHQNTNNLLKKIAKEQNIPLHEGVYVAVPGPNLETRAEYRYLKTIGADAVGMSTVPEVIVANQVGLPCNAISVLTDECDPDNLHPINLADILATAKKAEDLLITLISKLFKEMAS